MVVKPYSCLQLHLDVLSFSITLNDFPVVHLSLTVYLPIVWTCTGNDEGVRSRALTEEHARDSFENLLFSVCRFRELTGRYPQNITVSFASFENFESTVYLFIPV